MMEKRIWNIRFSNYTFTKYMIMTGNSDRWVIFSKEKLDAYDWDTAPGLDVEMASDPSVT